MDKSDSELLEEWDLVSSVYDTEQENDVKEKKTDANTQTTTSDSIEATTSSNTETTTNGNTETTTNGNTETTTNGNTETTTNGNVKISTDDSTENQTDICVKNSESISEEVISVDTRTVVDQDTEAVVQQIGKTNIVTEQTPETGAIIEQTPETDAIIEPTADADAVTEQTTEADSIIEQTTEVDTVTEEVSEADSVIEQITEIDTLPEEIIEADIPEQITETVGQVAEIDHVKNTNVDTEKSIGSDTEEITDANVTKIDDANIKKPIDADIKISNDAEKMKNNETESEAVTDHNIDAITEYSTIDNIDDHVLNSSLDSSMEHIQLEHCEGTCVQDIPELIPNLAEQEHASIESSSSDIDIIDENMEESVTSSFLHPLSLSISSSVDTSSILTTPSEDDKDVKIEEKVEDVMEPEKIESHNEKPEPFPRVFKCHVDKPQSESYSRPEPYMQKLRHEDRDENASPQSQRPHPHHAASNIFAGILEFMRNMTRFEWSILGGVVLCLYVTVVFNQTNIFAVVEKESVVSQMKKMIDELKHDNKILKDQMLSEMKNEKIFSSFEHQIKELRKENSKLNHMLYDVAKVLEKQKDSHENFEKREAEYLAPFKKEINKLKEHINILKFDNEELQKQLVRMRYASYSQGGQDTSDDKIKEQEEKNKADGTASTDEITLDINSLKKWNELISLLSKELGLLSENKPLSDEKSHLDIRNISWYWKVLLHEFKGTFKDFKANITSIISDYRKANEKAVSEIYKFVKDFFTVNEEYNQKITPPGEESSQWNNIGDFVSDLKQKWTKIKDRIYTSDLKNFLKDFKKSFEVDTSHDEYNSQKPKSTAYEYNERKPTNVHFDSERKPTDVHFESERKHDKVISNSEDSKWMFKRAELRAELRDAEKEDPSVNWFLKRKKRTTQDDTEIKY